MLPLPPGSPLDCGGRALAGDLRGGRPRNERVSQNSGTWQSPGASETRRPLRRIHTVRRALLPLENLNDQLFLPLYIRGLGRRDRSRALRIRALETWIIPAAGWSLGSLSSVARANCPADQSSIKAAVSPASSTFFSSASLNFEGLRSIVTLSILPVNLLSPCL